MDEKEKHLPEGEDIFAEDPEQFPVAEGFMEPEMAQEEELEEELEAQERPLDPEEAIDEGFPVEEGFMEPEMAQEEEIAEELEEFAEEQAEETGGAGEELLPEGRSSRSSLKGLIVGMGALAAVAVGLLASGILDNTVYMPVAYAKNNALYLNAVKEESYQAFDGISNGGEYGYAYLAWGVDVSEDNGMVTFEAEVAADGTYSLYRRQSTGKGAAATPVATGVLAHQVSADGSAVAYITGDGTLRYQNGGMETDVATGIEAVEAAFSISGDGGYVAYRVPGETAYSIYVYDSKTGNVDLMTDNAQSFLLRDGGLFFIVYNQDDAGTFQLYDYPYGGAEQCIVENAIGVMVGPDQESLMYLVGTGEETLYSDMVVDDCAAADAAIQEPVYSDYGDEEWEALMEDYNAYEAKVLREGLRESLPTAGGVSILRDCYVYRNGASALVAENVVSASILEDGVVYLALPEGADGAAVKANLSDATSLEGVLNAYYQKLGEACVTYYKGTAGEAVATANVDLTLQNFQVSPDGQKVFCLGLDENGAQRGALASLNDPQAVQYLPEDAAKALFAETGHGLAYYTGLTENHGALWYIGDGEPVQLSGDCFTFFFSTDGTELYFLETEADGVGVLKVYAGGQVTTIDKNVYFANYYDNGVVAYLKDYNEETAEGDLYLWAKGKQRLLDTEVSHLYLYL